MRLFESTNTFKLPYVYIFPDEKQRLMLQYQEAGTAFRSVDTRIWGIYALYFAANGGGLALLFGRQYTLHHYTLLIVCLGLFAFGVGQIALIGHLHCYSDHFAEILRDTERLLGISVHKNIRYTPSPQFLCGPESWFWYLRARDVMQCFTIILSIGWLLYPIYKACPSISKALYKPENLLKYTAISYGVAGILFFLAWLVIRWCHAQIRKRNISRQGD
jgi:hypothetical protein